MKTLQLFFAHPDDESFTCGGVVAKYVAKGATVHLVCATNGEAGNTGPYEMINPKQLGAIRQSELEHAIEILGISTVTYLNLADGRLGEGPAGELEHKLYLEMLKRRPDIVITFDSSGISNHPDHIAISHATTYAFQQYAKQLLVPQQKKVGQKEVAG